MRLDLYLVEKKLCSTRSKASQLIRSGNVLLNDKPITNKGYDVKEKDVITIRENDVLKFVSRGGHKLEKAIRDFHLNFKDKVICDIGASTGGFTDCALKYGAKKVYSIDVGESQLVQELRDNPRVVTLENTNFRYIDKKKVFKDKIDFYVCDVSFISSREIIKTLVSFKEDFHLILLFKPQFEVGKERINDNGVVSKTEYLVDALEDFHRFLKEEGLVLLKETYSPIVGNKEGNIEFLMEIASKGNDIKTDEKGLVEKTVAALS